MPPVVARSTRWLLVVLPVIVLVVSHPIWLGLAGAALVRSDPPARADLAVVLAGGWRGNRILKAAELVREGWVTRVLVSGIYFYDWAEPEAAIAFAVRHGYPREWFIPIAHRAESTAEEARIITEKLRQMGVRRILLVTSDYHTRRAASCFRHAASELEIRVIAAPDPDFPKPWWRSRQGRKTFVLEWLKTASWRLGM